MAETLPVVVYGVLRGMDTALDRPLGKAEALLNVWRRGDLLRPRPGFRSKAFRAGAVVGLYVYQTRTDSPTVISIRADSALNAMMLHTHKTGGALTGTWDLTALFGCPLEPRTLWCFEEMYGRVYFSSTRGGVLAYDPQRADPVYRPTAPGPADEQLLEHSMAYFTQLPPAGIMRAHAGQMFYAGFEAEFTVRVNNPLPAVQDIVHARRFAQGSKDAAGSSDAIVYFPQDVIYSEREEPWNIPALYHEIVQSKYGVTGLESFGQEFLVYTPEGIRALTVDQVGANPANTLRKVTLGAGNVAPLSARVTEGGVIHLGPGGFYRYDGQTIRYASREIEGLFTGDGLCSESLPHGLHALLRQTPYNTPLPLRASKHRLHMAVACECRGAGLYVCAVPLESNVPRSLLCVYDYRNDDWYLWLPQGSDTDPFDVTYVCSEEDPRSGLSRLWVGTRDGGIAVAELVLFARRTDVAPGGHEFSYPCLWSSTFLMGTDFEKEAETIRIRCRHRRKAGTVGATAEPGWAFIETEQGVWDCLSAVVYNDTTTWPDRQAKATLRLSPDETERTEFDDYHDIGAHGSILHARSDIITARLGARVSRSDWMRLVLFWPSNSYGDTGIHSVSVDLRQGRPA